MAAPKRIVTEAELRELEELTREEVRLLREVSLVDLWTFATKVLWPDTSSIHYFAPLHQPICEWIGTDEAGARRLLLMPRAHRKTMLVTVAHAIWRITRDPNVRIILVSALDDTAQQFTQMIKRQFQYNENYLAIFPEMRVDRNSQFGRTYDFTHPSRRTTDLIDPTFRSFYLGAPVAGRRCDILIADDPIEKKHVTTPEQADKALKDFNDLLPIVDRSSRYNMMYVVGTRWSYNDIYAAMLGDSRGEEQRVALATKRFESVVRHCLEDEQGAPDFEHGEPILPSVFSRDTLIEVLDEYRMDPKRGEEDWWKQYMNVCMSPGGSKFEESWFDRWAAALPGAIAASYILCDSANKDEQVLMKGDYTVALTVHFDVFGNLFITDGVRSNKMRAAELSRQLVAMASRAMQDHGVSVVNFAKEKVGEDTFFAWVRSEFARARLHVNTYPLQVRGQGKKYVRIVEALQHPLMAGQVVFVHGFDPKIHEALVAEAIHLGQWSHDDAIDCLSLAFHPDVRVRPLQGAAHEWKVPYNARVKQLSTGQTNPAAFTSLDVPTPSAPTAPKRWTIAGAPATLHEGGQLRPDPFLALRGMTQPIDVTTGRPGPKEE